MPTGEWKRIEWQHDSTNTIKKLWWDAVEHPSLSPYDIPDITAAWFGWQAYQPSTEELGLWVDEIAIDSQRIGCVI